MAFGKLKKWLEGAAAQVNPFDNGKTFQTVQQHGASYTPPRPQPAQTAPAPSQPSKAERVGLTIGLGGLRSATGLAQGLSGIYDLATPGKGTNRFSKGLDNFAKQVDATAKAENINPAGYKASQFGSDLLTFAAGGAAAKAASKIPTVAKVAGPATSVGEKISNPITNNLIKHGAPGRIVATGVKATFNPSNLANTTGFTALTTGADASKGRDINPKVVAENFAQNLAFNAGLPMAGQALHESYLGIRGVKNPLKNVNLMDTPEIRQLKAQKQASVEAFHNSNPKMAKAHAENVRNLDQQIQAIQQGGYVRLRQPQVVEPPVLPKTETAAPPLPPVKVSTQTMTPPPGGPKVKIGELPPGKTKATRFASKTVPESNVVSEPVKGSIKAPEYSPQTERQGYASSLSRLQKEGDKTFENNVFANLEKKPGTISRQEAIDATTHAQLLDSKGDDASIRKATQIYEKLSEHYTAAGQTVQVAAIMSRRTPAGMKGWAISTLKKEGVKPSTELQRQITDLAQQKNFTDLADLVSKNVPSSTADKIINFWRAGLLTAPTTTAGNLLGNSGEAAVRKGFVNPVATAADVVMGKFTGKRTMTLAKPGEAGSGFIQGAKEFGKGVDGAKYDVPKRTNYDTKVIDGYVNGVYRLMGVADTPFSGAAEREALSSIAKAEAINKGLKGKAKDQFVKEFMAKPSEQAIARAKQEADYAVFKNPTALGKVAAGAKRPAGAVGDFFIPFTQVPAAIATRIVERTPIGIANQVVKQIKHIKTGGEFDQRAMSQAIGNGLFGPAIMGAGYALAQNGQLTFGYPTDKKERALWDAEGKQPYSVRVGDRWYSLNYLQPFGTLLSVGGQAADAAKKGKNVQQIVAQGVATAGQSVANQSFLKGISGALDAITDPERSVQKYVEQTTSSVVPNFIRSGARAADPIQRKPEGIVEGVKSGIPGLRQQTTPKYNEITGEPLPAKDTFANQYLNPLKPSKVKGDQVTSELARLQSTENGVIPTQYNKSALGKNNKLTDKQVQDLQSSITPQVNKEWSNLIKSQEYQQSSDEDKAKMLKKVSEQVSAQGKTDFSNKNKISYTPSTSSGQINSKIDPHSQKVLKEYYTLSQERKDQKAYGENDYDYKVIKAKYDNDLANNKLSKKEKVTRLEAVKKAEVGSKYSKDVRDFYSLNKNDLWDYLSTEEQGQDKQKLANDILAYDKSLKAAGLISKLKFGSGFASSSGGRKGGRKGKGITLSGADLSANDAPKSVGIKIGNKRAPGTSMRVPKGIRVAKAKPVKLGGGKIRKVSV